MGWIIKSQSPGNLIGTLHLQKHTAVVDIKHDIKNYSIMCKNSTSLKYNGTSIHSNYNGWIENLKKAINVQLSAL
jgi:hypothetical protein